MNSTTEAVARMLAYADGTSLPVTDATVFTTDTTDVLAITFVKMVSENVAQAVAFGHPDRPPRVLVRWNPLSRESGDLEPLAAAVHAHIAGALDANRCPRVWLPHESALEMIDLLGRRYRRNPAASAALQQMGVELRALSSEAGIDGQQAVAVAGRLLREHYVTGQAAAKDGHLGALLHWIESPAGSDGAAVAAAADELALVPASNVLERRDDDRAEDLRRRAKAAGGGGPAHAELVRLLHDAALREWALLRRARNAWRGARLPILPGAADLLDDSRDRLAFDIRVGAPSRSRGPALASALEVRSAARAKVEHLRLAGDARVRRQASVTGHCVRATVTAVDQPRPNFNPCDLALVTDQPVVRLRRGSHIALVGSKVTATVTDLDEAPGGGWLIRARVTGAVRSRPGRGSAGEWIPAGPPDLEVPKGRAAQSMRAAGHPLVTGDPLPAGSPRPMPADLLAAAEALRGRS